MEQILKEEHYLRNEENLNVSSSDSKCSSSNKRGHESIESSEEHNHEQSTLQPPSKSLKLNVEPHQQQDDLEILLNRLKEIEEEKCKIIQEFKLQEALLEKERLEILSMITLGNEEFDTKKPVHLNVGGYILTICMGVFVNSVREPNNVIDKMFKGIIPLHETPSLVFEEKVFFIDCDVAIFKIIIEWMKTGECEKLSEKELKLVLRACEEFGFENFRNHLIQEKQATLPPTASDTITNSNILDPNILRELFEKHVKSKNDGLLYRGTRDGFKATDFHKHCDQQGKTVTIVQSRNGHIFGGFTSNNWESSKGFRTDPSAFIFKIDSASISRFDIKSDSYRNAISCDIESLPSFGLDFKLSSSCNENSNSYSNFGHTYQLPTGFTYESEQARKYLAGSCKFQVVEIEVFKAL
ncbi:predicted protein [Naegleria gruberi]|uniref:Predicted protein n=1 Tax=Naegleria gruberi TaxID=5762 RepID=D2W381_NAEGR|nr:uncharacterized protein NAEGRDRAFT_75851 [Naegleria gruberi]EFC36444.1 predicted protein [Naegleria gruberi]|eukprot:XP_002669188.1 predicted protein [Naegleria gruberi strain NEG-M]